MIGSARVKNSEESFKRQRIFMLTIRGRLKDMLQAAKLTRHLEEAAGSK